MRYCFRVDSSDKIASGHLSRCLTLASYLRNNGHECFFISRDLRGNFNHKIEQQNFTLLQLEEPLINQTEKEDAPVPHSSWLEVTKQKDSEDTIQILKQNSIIPDWLIIDHYALDHTWHSSMRDHVHRIMVIDDLADRKYQCDLLLDQNLLANMQKRYSGKVNGDCELLLGPQYALLKAELSSKRVEQSSAKQAVKRIFVFFGGVDKHGLTLKTLKGFKSLSNSGLTLDVVLPATCPDKHSIRDLSSVSDNINLHENLPSLGDLMLQADISIGGCGVTAWERLCLGLYSIVVTMADNQMPMAEELHLRKLVNHIGAASEVSEDLILRNLNIYIEKGLPPGIRELSMKEVDGKGLSRVCSFLEETASR